MRVELVAEPSPLTSFRLAAYSGLGKAGGGAPAPDGKNVDHVCLRIEPFDVAALATHLRSHGIEPGEVGTRYGADGFGPSMYLRDPDGNVVELKGPPEA